MHRLNPPGPGRQGCQGGDTKLDEIAFIGSLMVNIFGPPMPHYTVEVAGL